MRGTHHPIHRLDVFPSKTVARMQRNVRAAPTQEQAFPPALAMREALLTHGLGATLREGKRGPTKCTHRPVSRVHATLAAPPSRAFAACLDRIDQTGRSRRGTASIRSRV